MVAHSFALRLCLSIRVSGGVALQVYGIAGVLATSGAGSGCGRGGDWGRARSGGRAWGEGSALRNGFCGRQLGRTEPVGRHPHWGAFKSIAALEDDIINLWMGSKCGHWGGAVSQSKSNNLWI
jgi:hypothetical protein